MSQAICDETSYPQPVGVLALQGAVDEHVQALQRCGVQAVPVRRPGELEGLAGLVLPGGESTTLGKLLVAAGLLEPLRQRARAGWPMFGSCAGMILLADRLADAMPDQPTIGGLDVLVRRNAFGRQVDSAQTTVQWQPDGQTPTQIPAVLIRAPVVEQFGPGVQILARLGAGGPIVAVRQVNLLATSFHPELDTDLTVHRYFLHMLADGRNKLMIELTPTATLTQYLAPEVVEQPADRAAVLILPGGGYLYTSPREGAPVALMFNTANCHAFVLDYTTVQKNPAVTMEIMLGEVEQALNLILSNARNWRVDITRLMVCGFSAGGHLAALAANQFHRKISRQILCYPALDVGTYPPDPSVWDPQHEANGLLAGLFATRPIDGVHERTPPTFLWHTGGDTTVPIGGSIDYAAALTRAGVSCEAHLYAGARHGMSLATPASARDDAHIDPHIATWATLLQTWLPR